MRRSDDGKTRILSLSYGKDSMACLGAIEQLGLPLDRIVTADVWATQDIRADLPPMVDFKQKADKIIKDRWGIEVEHFCATNKQTGGKLSFEDIFYRHLTKGKGNYGFPIKTGQWCLSTLKKSAINKSRQSLPPPFTQYKERHITIFTDSQCRRDIGFAGFETWRNARKYIDGREWAQMVYGRTQVQNHFR